MHLTAHVMSPRFVCTVASWKQGACLISNNLTPATYCGVIKTLELFTDFSFSVFWLTGCSLSFKKIIHCLFYTTPLLVVLQITRFDSWIRLELVRYNVFRRVSPHFPPRVYRGHKVPSPHLEPINLSGLKLASRWSVHVWLNTHKSVLKSSSP